MNWDYDSVLTLFEKAKNYADRKWFEINSFSEGSYYIRFTKNVLLDANKRYLTFYSPLKKSYMVESDITIWYDDLEDIKITYLPFEVEFSLKNVKTKFTISTPLKWDWGFDIKSIPVYCEDRWNEIYEGVKNE